ncbi:MAG: AMP-binding protein [Desulfovibrio sp.]|uniref:AMP-binding protein n=6 Tax=Desulfovibrio TaxID=872 RepID=A0A848C6S7_9BACT|nr:AMP-binding protein [Desulfovibrio piger]MDY4673014.1 AMP-binding protein [Desulfovibrio sp.]NME51941.1 AMP-binding protein [Desulfovibrio piger]
MTTPSQTETARPLDGAMENILDDGQRPGWWRHFAGHEDTECVIRPMHLASLLDRAARTHGNRLAIRFQNFQMTYSRLHEAAERFAEALRLRGVKPGQRVAVMLPNIPQTVIAFWGIMKAGAVAVMTNPLYMEKELLHHFNDAGAEVLVTLDLLWAKLEPLRDRLPLRLTVVTNISDGLAFPLNWLYRIKARRQGQVPQVPYGQEVLRWKDFIKVRGRFSVPTDEDPGDALALLQYTGGTSGQPKGAMLGHACISAQMQQLLAILHMDWENCKPMSFLSIMPFFHVFGLVGNIILPTALAATTIPVPRYTPADLLRTIARFRPTFFVGAPSVYMSLMQQKDIKKYDLTCIEICVSGSAPFPTEALRRWVSMTHASITEGFGLTEASPCVTANPLDGPQKEGSIGVAFPHTEIRIVDINDSNHVLGPNEEGEMLVRGPQVMQGYWNRPEETAVTLTDGWLHTGDIAYYDEEGYYYIVDRKKDLVIVGGYNVYPREVDEVLYEHPKVAEAVAVGVKHPTRGEVLKAYVVPRPGETLTTAELTAHCRARLANYKVPKFFEFREELPKSLIGKVLRRILRDEEAARVAQGQGDEDRLLPTPDQPAAAPTRAQALGQQAGELLDEAREKMDSLRGQAGEMMEEARQKAGELRRQSGEVVDEARQKAGELLDEARGKAGEMMEEARQKAGELRRQSGEMVDKARGKAGELGQQAGELLDEAREKMGSLRGQAGEMMEEARHKAEELRRQSGEVVDGARQKAGELLQEARGKAGELGQQAGELLDKARGKSDDEKK